MTSATAAIMLAAFQIFDLQPGPQLFDKNPDLVWALIASLYIGNVAFLNRPLSIGLLAVAAMMLVAPHMPAVARRLRGSPG